MRGSIPENVERWLLAAEKGSIRTAPVRLVATPRGNERWLDPGQRRDLERFFAISPDLLAVLGPDGYPKRVNAAYTAALGYSEHALLERPFLELFHPEDRDEARIAVEKVLGGQEGVRVTLRVLRCDGQARWFTFDAFAEKGASELAVVGRDVTDERNRAEFEQHLIGIVSHDLRNPLTAIATTVATLLRRNPDIDERTLRDVTRIRSIAERAMALIRDLLDFTKARTAGGIAVAPEPMDLHEVARTAAAEVQSAFPDRELRYEQSGDGEGVWDPARIGQVVSNLVSNAFKYGATDAPVVLRTSGEDGTVRLEIHNRGAPIDPALLPHIFEALRQGRGAGGGSVAGVGLGLYIVERVVHAHGGRIEVFSTQKDGTTFVVHLPRARDVAPASTRTGARSAA